MTTEHMERLITIEAGYEDLLRAVCIGALSEGLPVVDVASLLLKYAQSVLVCTPCSTVGWREDLFRAAHMVVTQGTPAIQA